MKNNKDITLRNGHVLKYVGGDLWEFHTGETWMPVTLTYGDAPNQIIMLDSDGLGLPLMVGGHVRDYRVVSMFENDGKFMVAMKPLIKEYVKDLESGDIIWVTNSDKDYSLIRFEVASVLYHDMERMKWYEITSKANKIIFVKDEDSNDMLNSENGVKTSMHGNSERVFSNNMYAKNYLYDIIQDKINELRNRQKEIML